MCEPYSVNLENNGEWTMKLKRYEASLSEKMSEFDIWVTPALEEIRDTPQFRENLDTLKSGFDLLSQITDDFADCSHCSSSALSNNTIESLNKRMKIPQ